MKKFTAWSLGAKIMVVSPVFMIALAISAILLNGASLMPLVSLLAIIGWLILMIFIIKYFYLIIKNPFK